jgi:hypothetical protein
MFRSSEVVGVSKPAKPATLFRAISNRFIQTGRWAKLAKKISMTPALGRRSDARYASLKSAPSIRVLSRARSRKARRRRHTHPGLGAILRCTADVCSGLMPSPARKRWKTNKRSNHGKHRTHRVPSFPAERRWAGERMRRPQWPQKFYSRNLRAACAAGLLRLAASQALSLG